MTELHKTSIPFPNSQASLPVVVEYRSDGIKVEILDIYLDADIIFGEDTYRSGIVFSNPEFPFEAILGKKEDEIYSDLKDEISAEKFLSHMKKFVDSRKAI